MSYVSKQMAMKVVYWNAVAALIIVALAGTTVLRRAHQFDTLIFETSREFNVDPRLVSSVIWKESRFVPTRVGKAGEIGLMQITEGAALDWAKEHEIEDFDKRDLYDPVLNVRVGTWYLTKAINDWSAYSDPLPYALAQYNAGRNNALRWSKLSGTKSKHFWNAITYPTTKRYVRDILTRYRGGV